MEPTYYYQRAGAGKESHLLVLNGSDGQRAYRFASTEQSKPPGSWKKGCGLGCLGAVLALFIGDGDFLDFGGGSSPSPKSWQLERVDGTVVFQVKKIRRGLDILRDDVSVGRIEWKKRKRVVDHQVLWGDRLIGTAVPDGMMRNEVSIEIPGGTLAVLKQTQGLLRKNFGEVYLRRYLPEEELGLILAVGLLWL